MPTEESILETLRFMVETHRTEFERRRSYEWKGFLTGLTFFVLVAAARMHEKTGAAVAALPAIYVWFTFLAFWLVGTVFLAYAHTADALNKEIAHRAEAAIQNLLNGKEYLPLSLYSDLPTRPTWKGFVRIGAGGFWGLSCESAAILVFAVGCGLVVTS